MRSFATPIALLFAATPALAAGTITHSFDAHGRLVTVAHGGYVNNGVTTSYQHDKADNRIAATTVESTTPPPPG